MTCPTCKDTGKVLGFDMNEAPCPQCRPIIEGEHPGAQLVDLVEDAAEKLTEAMGHDWHVRMPRLIALGEWAEKHAIPALKNVNEWFDRMRDDHDDKLGKGFDRAVEQWPHILQEPLDMSPIKAALSALPKEKP